MTIAACYHSSEGIVLGADSTTSSLVDGGGYHYFNHNQKIFEVGENSTLGIMTWGLASLGPKSYRALIANLADDLESQPPKKGMAEVADRWRDFFWNEYQTDLKPAIQRCKDLNAKVTHDPANAASRTEAEETELKNLKANGVAGFCIAGYWRPERTLAAYQIVFDLLSPKPTPRPIPTLHYGFWGAPNMMKRLIWGADDNLKADILGSSKWGDTPAELDKIFEKQRLGHANLPVRDAIDFVHTCIYCTIKALKFSNLPQICGGPIELAVITSDRKFRWVAHKDWDSAILET
jgi:hypothetical protein